MALYRQASGSLNGSQENVKNSDGNGTLEHGLSQWKVQTATALRDGAADLRSMILKVFATCINLYLVFLMIIFHV